MRIRSTIVCFCPFTRTVTFSLSLLFAAPRTNVESLFRPFWPVSVNSDSALPPAVVTTTCTAARALSLTLKLTVSPLPEVEDLAGLSWTASGACAVAGDVDPFVVVGVDGPEALVTPGDPLELDPPDALPAAGVLLLPPPLPFDPPLLPLLPLLPLDPLLLLDPPLPLLLLLPPEEPLAAGACGVTVTENCVCPLAQLIGLPTESWRITLALQVTVVVPIG